MFKRMLYVLTAILLIIGIPLSPSSEGATVPVKGYGYSSGPVSGTSQIVKSSGGQIYDIVLQSGNTSGLATIYDCNIGTANCLYNSSLIVLEVETATANSSMVVPFGDAPLATNNGIEVSTASSTTVFLNYN